MAFCVCYRRRMELVFLYYAAHTQYLALNMFHVDDKKTTPGKKKASAVLQEKKQNIEKKLRRTCREKAMPEAASIAERLSLRPSTSK